MSNIQILVVQNEDAIRASVCKLLKKNGYYTKEAVSVIAARKHFNLSKFNVIISDLRLPGDPGTELIALAKPVPVIIMTSYASLRSAVDTMRQGAADYIPKPFDQDELLASVKRILAETKPSLGDSYANRHQDLSKLSMEDYFTHFILQNQNHMSETLLAKKLGISRKTLWQRRQKLGIPRIRKAH